MPTVGHRMTTTGDGHRGSPRSRSPPTLPTRAAATATAAVEAPALDSPEDKLLLPPQQQTLPSSFAGYITPPPTKKQKKARQANYTSGENIALFKAFFNCTLNPINGIEQKEKAFAMLLHQKFVALIIEARDPEELKLLPARDVESIWNRRNEFLPFWRQAKLYPPSGTTTEEEILNHAKELFYEAKHRKFIYGHCTFILKSNCQSLIQWYPPLLLLKLLNLLLEKKEEIFFPEVSPGCELYWGSNGRLFSKTNW